MSKAKKTSKKVSYPKTIYVTKQQDGDEEYLTSSEGAAGIYDLELDSETEAAVYSYVKTVRVVNKTEVIE